MYMKDNVSNVAQYTTKYFECTRILQGFFHDITEYFCRIVRM